MNYALIIVAYTAYGGLTSSVIDFPTQALCERAKVAIIEASSHTPLIPIVTCVAMNEGDEK